jgi:hypothetical protein
MPRLLPIRWSHGAGHLAGHTCQGTVWVPPPPHHQFLGAGRGGDHIGANSRTGLEAGDTRLSGKQVISYSLMSPHLTPCWATLTAVLSTPEGAIPWEMGHGSRGGRYDTGIFA